MKALQIFPRQIRPRLGRFGAISLILGSLLALTACAPSTFKLGASPPVERLGELRAGESTKADVRRVIGTPQGGGASRLPDYPGYREVWSYEVVEVRGGTESEFRILLVFFDKDTYDGYLWFENAAVAQGTS